VARLRAVLSDVANVTTEVNTHVDALGRAQGELSMEAEPTDFAAVLADGTAAAPDAHGWVPTIPRRSHMHSVLHLLLWHLYVGHLTQEATTHVPSTQQRRHRAEVWQPKCRQADHFLACMCMALQQGGGSAAIVQTSRTHFCRKT
jgi:hypothetical protein